MNANGYSAGNGRGRGAETVDAILGGARRLPKDGGRAQHFSSVALFAVFVVVLLLALEAGASTYGSLLELQAQNDARIMTTGPILSSIRANDRVDAVDEGRGPEGPALVLRQTLGEYEYETRIYLYKGAIVQEYVPAESGYAPDRATRLADSSTFSFEHADGMLSVTCDAGTVKVALRSEQGGA